MADQYRSRPQYNGSMASRENPRGTAQGAPEPSLDKLWPGYLAGGYFDSAGNLKPEHVERDRILPLLKAMDEARPRLTMHQARRFFQHCRGIEARLRSKASTWAAEEAAFRKLDVAAADAFGKKDSKIPRIFHDFIKKNVSAVRTEKSFLQGFLPHFEALIGFGAGVLRERERS